MQIMLDLNVVTMNKGIISGSGRKRSDANCEFYKKNRRGEQRVYNKGQICLKVDSEYCYSDCIIGEIRTV